MPHQPKRPKIARRVLFHVKCCYSFKWLSLARKWEVVRGKRPGGNKTPPKESA
jgi:hypothetical protein